MENNMTPGEAPLKGDSEGIDSWNDRLDENLEPTDTGDPEADEKAKAFSDQNGSGDQSDQADSPGKSGTPVSGQ
jgi:hypothetical protein